MILKNYQLFKNIFLRFNNLIIGMNKIREDRPITPKFESHDYYFSYTKEGLTVH
jgi:hypothetical protein